MQKIFSREIRFRDENGNDYPDWEEKRLGEVADVKRGAGSQYFTYVNSPLEGIRLLRINDFLWDDDVYVEDTEAMKRFRVKTNDILIAGTGATAGITYIIPEKFNELAFSYNAPRIRVKNAHYAYIIYYLKSFSILKQQESLFTGNAQKFLDINAIRGFKIRIPKSLDEQKRIANFLMDINIKIEQVSIQLTQIQKFKKGLLQQMFV